MQLTRATVARSAASVSAVRLFFDLFKLRIGLVIGFTAVTGLAITPGPRLSGWQVLTLALAVTMASAAAGAFNQLIERDIDARMRRTRRRAFVTGALTAGPLWLAAIALIALAGVALAAVAINAAAALYTFLGAFTYAVVYTAWLKRRTPWNIVIGGLAGSFAVLAGAAAVTPDAVGSLPLAFAAVLFLWTPPHFWSLAAAKGDDYARAKIPMLPVVAPAYAWTSAVLAHAVALAAISLVPLWFGSGIAYGICAAIGGFWFVWKSILLHRDPSKANAMGNFFASLLQLALLVAGALLSSAAGLLS
jgi:heme o synthase